MSSLYNQNFMNKSFGIGSRLFALIFIYYASRGSEIFLLITISVIFILLLGLAIKNFKVNFSLPSIILILILFFNLVISLLAPSASMAYISSQCILLILAIIGLNLEKYFFTKESVISRYIVWVIGITLLIVYIATFFNPSYVWIFETFFLPQDEVASAYSSGAVRFYTVAAVCFLIIPANGYSKVLSFFINALPLSPVNIISWFLIHIRLSYLLFFSFFIALFFIVYSSNNSIFFYNDFLLFIEDKLLSLASRYEKLSELNLIGSSIHFNDDFSETFWIALSQTNGLVPASAFFIFFFYNIIKMSHNLLFIIGAFILTIVNPFPLALIYLLADSWNNKKYINE